MNGRKRFYPGCDGRFLVEHSVDVVLAGAGLQVGAIVRPIWLGRTIKEFRSNIQSHLVFWHGINFFGRAIVGGVGNHVTGKKVINLILQDAFAVKSRASGILQHGRH